MEIFIRIKVDPNWLLAITNVLIAISNFFVVFHHQLPLMANALQTRLALVEDMKKIRWAKRKDVALSLNDYAARLVVAWHWAFSVAFAPAAY